MTYTYNAHTRDVVQASFVIFFGCEIGPRNLHLLPINVHVRFQMCVHARVVHACMLSGVCACMHA